MKMLRNSSEEALLSGAQSSSSAAAHRASSAGLRSQESSWIGFLSRPPWALLQNYLPSRIRTAALSDQEARCFSGGLKAKSDIFGPLGDVTQLPVPPLGSSGPSWLTAESLREVGLEPLGHLDLNSSVSSATTCLSYGERTSAQSLDWAGGASGSRPWWGSWWGGELRGVTARLCTQTKDPWPAGTENTGGLETAQNPAGYAECRLSSDVAVLTQDQDHGYSSLEEELVRRLKIATMPSASAPPGPEAEGRVEAVQSGPEVDVSMSCAPSCQNKAIAFIMGCPCSDDDSQSRDGDDDGFDSDCSSELSTWADKDASSDSEDAPSDGEDAPSDGEDAPSDGEDAHSDGEDAPSDGEDAPWDDEAERLWRSLCQSRDPYNPQHFTAHQHAVPRTAPTAMPLSSSNSSPAFLPLPSSPPSVHDDWEESTSASEADEAESTRLLSSFTSNDPYDPFNFQATLRTQGPAHCHHASSPPEYVKEQTEERLDSGFSEPTRRSKKVRFCEDVEEFFASCGEEEEDRKGPWEEVARDRCRFLRRCQEVELCISFCLQPHHRSRVWQHRLAATQDI